MDSFRCIHAERLLLDHQLRGVQSTFGGPLAPEARKIIQDATLIAFEHIIEQALARDVHCVLLSGECFDPVDRGLRGPAALVKGIQRLAEHDIPVMLQAEHPDLWSSWPAGLRWPANAHRLGAGLATSVSITREGKQLATIAVDDPAQLPDGRLTAAPGGWQIQLPAAHPAGTGTTVTTNRLRGHDLNAAQWRPAQGIRADEFGPHGCTLIEIDSTNEPRCTFVAAAPVRWERLSIEVSAETHRDDLLQEMASRLEQTLRQACEKVWLIAWDMTGIGPLFERLENRVFRDELLADLTALEPIPGVRIHTHALRLKIATGHLRPIADAGALLEKSLLSPNGFDPQALDKDLATEFAKRLDERFANPEKAIAACLASPPLAEGPWLVKIESLIAGLDAGEVAQSARGLAMRSLMGPGFAEPGELSS